MNDLTVTPQNQHPVEPTKALSPVLLGQYPKSSQEVDQAERDIQRIDTKADRAWIAHHAVAFLTAHYFVSDMAAETARTVGRDWVRELTGLPDWAIEKAFAWWISRHNPKRAKRPLPGDISAKAHAEAAIISVGRTQIKLFEQYGPKPPSWLKN